MSGFASDRPGCFLCSPEPEWTWLESEHFRAVLGLGPIGLGYTLIATREHVPSMLDLDDTVADELGHFTKRVRKRLEPLFGPTSLGEHGRVAACVGPALKRYQPHCLHAHRLVFPNLPKLSLKGVMQRTPPREFPSFVSAREATASTAQYLYVEDPSGRCEVVEVSGPLPRQLLRFVAARSKGRPELADWRSRPGLHDIERARELLGFTQR